MLKFYLRTCCKLSEMYEFHRLSIEITIYEWVVLIFPEMSRQVCSGKVFFLILFSTKADVLPKTRVTIIDLHSQTFLQLTEVPITKGPQRVHSLLE